MEIRESIENSFSLVKYNVEALAEKGGFSFDALNVRLGKATGDTVNGAFKAKIENLKKEERIGTMEWYENIYLWVEKFGGNKISFDTITIDWLKRYERFLLKEALTLQEIGKIVRFSDGNETTERYKDLWFSCTCVMGSIRLIW